MNLNDLFKKIKTSFTVKRVIDIDGYDLHFVMEPLTSAEELKILEACVGLEGGPFVAQLKRSSLAYAIKKINNVEFYGDVIEYDDDDGKPMKESKYVCIAKQIDAMSTSLRDTLFDAFNNMQMEVEDLVNKNVKFERFTAQTLPENDNAEEVGIPKGFKKIDVPKEPEPENDTERLNQQVKKETEQVEMGMAAQNSR